MEKTLGLHVQVRCPYYQAAQCIQPEHTYSCILKVAGLYSQGDRLDLRKQKKG